MAAMEELALLKPGMQAEIDGKDYMVLYVSMEGEYNGYAVFLDMESRDITISWAEPDKEDEYAGNLTVLAEHGVNGMAAEIAVRNSARIHMLEGQGIFMSRERLTAGPGSWQRR